MSSRGGWGAMTHRVQRSHQPHATPGQPRAEPGPGEPAVVESELPPDVKHCWVSASGGLVPGLLVGWRRDDALGWLGRVVRPVRDEHGWLVLEDWLPADELRPANGAPPDK